MFDWTKRIGGLQVDWGEAFYFVCRQYKYTLEYVNTLKFEDFVGLFVYAKNEEHIDLQQTDMHFWSMNAKKGAKYPFIDVPYQNKRQEKRIVNDLSKFN